MRLLGIFKKREEHVMDVDFRYKGFDCSIILGVLRWKPGEADSGTLSAVWDDENVKEMLRDFALMEVNERLERRFKQSNRKWMAKAFKEEFSKDELLDVFQKAFDRLKKLVRKEAESTPNIDLIPGRDVKV